MSISKKTKSNKCKPGCRGKESLINWWRECKLVKPTMEINSAIPQKTKNRTTIQSCYTTPGYIPKGIKVLNRDTVQSCLLWCNSQ
jgi:hypothetical protein